MDENKRKQLWQQVQAGAKSLKELSASEKGIEDELTNSANWPILFEAAKAFLVFFGGLLGGIFGWRGVTPLVATKDAAMPAPKGFWDTIQQIWSILNLIYQFLQNNSLTAEEFKKVIDQAKHDIRDDVAASIPGQLRRMGAKFESKMTFDTADEDGK